MKKNTCHIYPRLTNTTSLLEGESDRYTEDAVRDDKTENNEGTIRGASGRGNRSYPEGSPRGRRGRGTSTGKGEQQVRVPVTRLRAAPENRRLCTR